MNKKEYWANFYDAFYENSLGSYALERDSRVIKQLVSSNSGVALDFPCGMGRHTKMLLSLGFDVVSADISAKMLEHIREKYGVEVMIMDLFSLPRSNRKFDVILSSRVFFHYEDLSVLLENLSGFLKPEGVLVFDTLNKYSTRYFIHKVLWALFGNRFVKEELYFRTKEEVLSILKDSGFEVQETVSAYILPTRAYKLAPSFLNKVFDIIERILPSQLRVLTFWKVRTSPPTSLLL